MMSRMLNAVNMQGHNQKLEFSFGAVTLSLTLI